MIGTSPNHRRRGLGRALYERFFDDVAGARRPPGDRGHVAGQPRISVAFHRAMGFDADRRARARRTCTARPAYPDYDADGEDRVVFSREL